MVNKSFYEIPTILPYGVSKKPARRVDPRAFARLDYDTKVRYSICKVGRMPTGRAQPSLFLL